MSIPAMIGPAEYFNMYFDWQGEYPVAIISTRNTLSAIFATIYVDRLWGGKV